MTFVSAVIGDNGPPHSPPPLPKQFEAADRSLSPQRCVTAVPGRIEIVLLRGHRVLVDNGVDTTVLARVLAVLERP